MIVLHIYMDVDFAACPLSLPFVRNSMFVQYKMHLDLLYSNSWQETSCFCVQEI